MSDLLHTYRAFNGRRLLFRSTEIRDIRKIPGSYGVELETIYGSTYNLVTSKPDEIIDAGERPSHSLMPWHHWFIWSPT